MLYKDVTSSCKDVTSCCKDVTSCYKDVTSCCKDVTSCCKVTSRHDLFLLHTACHTMRVSLLALNASGERSLCRGCMKKAGQGRDKLASWLLQM